MEEKRASRNPLKEKQTTLTLYSLFIFLGIVWRAKLVLFNLLDRADSFSMQERSEEYKNYCNYPIYYIITFYCPFRRVYAVLCVCLFADSPSDLCVFQFRPFFAHHSSSVQSAIGWCSEPKLEMWWDSEEFESSPSSTTWADTTRAESKVIRRWETTANSIQECNNIAREEPWQSKMRKEKHTKFHVEGFVWLFYSVFFLLVCFFSGIHLKYLGAFRRPSCSTTRRRRRRLSGYWAPESSLKKRIRRRGTETRGAEKLIICAM